MDAQNVSSIDKKKWAAIEAAHKPLTLSLFYQFQPKRSDITLDPASHA
jgi:hypothetical protein